VFGCTIHFLLSLYKTAMSENERLAKMGLDYSSVIQWSGRPQRVRKPPPLTYWEEFVVTDAWYVNELMADVPADEWDAAMEDEDWDAQVIEEDEEIDECDESECDDDYSEDSEEVSDGTDSGDEGSGGDVVTSDASDNDSVSGA
jgi:hypothetical protein